MNRQMRLYGHSTIPFYQLLHGMEREKRAVRNVLDMMGYPLMNPSYGLFFNGESGGHDDPGDIHHQPEIGQGIDVLIQKK